MRASSHRRVTGLSLSLMIAVILAAFGVGGPAAQAQECGVPTAIAIQNSGFEDPARPPGGDYVTSLPGWTVSGTVVHAGPGSGPFPSQFVQLGIQSASGTVSQDLDGTALAGRTVTFTVTAMTLGTISLGSQSQSIATQGDGQSFDFAVPADTTGPLTLSLSSILLLVDQITGTSVVPCPPGPVIPAGCADAVARGENVVYVADGGTGGSGRQVIIGTPGDDVIDGGSGHDLICGGGGHDTINGGSGDDVIYGDEGDDRLEGESGTDMLDGGEGWDACSGGSGANQVVGCEG